MEREMAERGRPPRQLTPTKRPNSSADSRVSAKFNRLDIGSLVNDERRPGGSSDGLPVLPPTNMPQTAAMRYLRGKEARRRWEQQRKRAELDLTQAHAIEAVMMYERGDIRRASDVCDRCKRGEGIWVECVSVPELPWVCSNCLHGHATCEKAASREDSPVLGNDSAFWEMTNELADRSFVLALVAQIRRRAGYGDEDSPLERAKEIEEAALKVARLTKEWRLAKQRKDSSPGAGADTATSLT